MWIFAALGCSAGHSPVLPTLAAAVPPPPELTLVWVGTSTAHRNEGGTWVRTPEQDYQFSVVQRRYADHWDSIKQMHRRHPDYGGEAGPRDQTLHFLLAYEEQGEELKMAIQSTLGEGTGRSDRTFREAAMAIDADLPAAAPFSGYRITQHYRYEDARLEETVELVDDLGQPGEEVWVRMEETAQLFVSVPLDGPPTQWPGEGT